MSNNDMTIKEIFALFIKTSFFNNTHLRTFKKIVCFTYFIYHLWVLVLPRQKKGLPAIYTESPFSLLTPSLFSWYQYNIRIRALCVIADQFIGPAKCGSTWLGFFVLLYSVISI
jgi:hypothetical protein